MGVTNNLKNLLEGAMLGFVCCKVKDFFFFLPHHWFISHPLHLKTNCWHDSDTWFHFLLLLQSNPPFLILVYVIMKLQIISKRSENERPALVVKENVQMCKYSPGLYYTNIQTLHCTLLQSTHILSLKASSLCSNENSISWLCI